MTVPLSEGAAAFSSLGAALYEQAAAFYADDARRVLQSHAERRQPPPEANARTAFKVPEIQSERWNDVGSPATRFECGNSSTTTSMFDALQCHSMQAAALAKFWVDSAKAARMLANSTTLSCCSAEQSLAELERSACRRPLWPNSALTGQQPRACMAPPTRSC